MSDPTNNRIILEPKVILQLFHYAEVVGMCNHQLANMIEQGASETQCLEELNKLLHEEVFVPEEEIPF